VDRRRHDGGRQGFRRLKARQQLPAPRDTLQRHHDERFGIEDISKAA